MATTYEKIASYAATGSVADITFSSIPSTYTDLVLKFSTRNSIADLDILIKFNGSTSSFTAKRLYGSGSGSGGTDSLARTAGLIEDSSYTASTFASNEIYIPNYASSTQYKSYSVDSVTENNATLSYVLFGAGLWSSNSAINSVTIAPAASNIVQFSTATLYGIKNS